MNMQAEAGRPEMESAFRAPAGAGRGGFRNIPSRPARRGDKRNDRIEEAPWDRT